MSNSFANEKRSLVSALVDNETLQPAELAELEKLRTSDNFRAQIAVIKAVKSTLYARHGALKIALPEDLEQSIRNALRREPAQLASTALRKRPLDMWHYAYALVVLLFVGLVWWMWNDAGVALKARYVAGFDLRENAYRLASEIRSGDVTLSIKSADSRAISDFFAANGGDYKVFFPPVNFTLERHGTY